MIGQLAGLVGYVEADHCLVDVNGVGYVVFASTQTLSGLSHPPEKVRLLIETIVREDAIQLFGFLYPEERAWFRLLTTVQGVGSRVALAILSVSRPVLLVQAVQAGDKTAFTRAVGVGPRLAMRILTELKDKMTKVPNLVGATESVPMAMETLHEEGLEHDALLALEGLGFRRAEAWPVVSRIVNAQAGVPLDLVIRLALKELAR